MGSLKRILLVCEGNTCRSPMGKVILEQRLKSEGLEKQFRVDSAAYGEPSGISANPNARQAIKELYGVDFLASHIPKKLTKIMADEADLIVVMEDYMKAGLPQNKVIALGIKDPLGSDKEIYKACAGAIKQSFENIWPQVYEVVSSFQKTKVQTPSVSAKMFVADFLKKHGIQPRITADWVYREVLKIAEKVDYGRGEHSKTVTRLMRDMYHDMAGIGFISDTPDKRKLAEIAGLSHDIGVHKEKRGEGHNAAGWRMLKEELWNEGLSSDRKGLLAVVMYAVFYHRDPVPDGKLKPLNGIPLEDYRTTAELVSLLRVADGLDFGLVRGSPDKIEKVEMVPTSKGVECRVFPRLGKNVTGLVAKSYDKREVFEATFGKLTFWLPGEHGSWVPWHL